MKKNTWFVAFILVNSVANAYEDRASSVVKRSMLVELYRQIDIHQIIASTEGRALMPTIKKKTEWGHSERECIMRNVHSALEKPIFEALLKQVPSELIAENVMFYQTEFGQRVNTVVIHGGGLSGLDIGEQTELKKNAAVLDFLGQLIEISQQTILDNMNSAVKPAMLACTSES
ncbi:hypothetical protein [Candidatus Thalassolituus haligoni]|uniref:hypothetical protein n=1 Tax=Candidatus Thalassolituus haligoni TaxID=3100113 RepID=UPI003511039A